MSSILARSTGGHRHHRARPQHPREPPRPRRCQKPPFPQPTPHRSSTQTPQPPPPFPAISSDPRWAPFPIPVNLGFHRPWSLSWEDDKRWSSIITWSDGRPCPVPLRISPMLTVLARLLGLKPSSRAHPAPDQASSGVDPLGPARFGPTLFFSDIC
jgi:hypothetical protein